MAAHLTQVPASLSSVRPEVPEELSDLVGQCVAKDAAHRPASAADVLRRLEGIAASLGVSGPQVARRAQRRLGRVLGIVAAPVLAVVAGVAIVNRMREPHAATVNAMVRVTSDPGLELYPDLSPVGNQLAYAAGSSSSMRVFVRPVDGEHAIRLTSDSTTEWQPRWSPDGSRILFLTPAGVVTTPPTGGAAHVIVAAPEGRLITSATWSSDGSEVAWSVGDSLYASPVGGGAARPIGSAREVHACSWSRSGRWIACATETALYTIPGATLGNTSAGTLVLFPASGGTAMRIGDSTSLNESPAWGPRDDELYFVSDRQNTRDIYVLPLDRSGHAGTVQRLTSGVSAHTIAVAAAGGRVAYSAYTTSSNLWSVELPAAGGTRSMREAVAVTRGNQTVESMSVSRDGRWLLFDSDRSGTADIYRMTLPAGEPERLTNDAGGEYKPDLSPDGRFLAYHALRSGSRDIFVKPLDGGALQQVTHTGQHEARPAWSPDGQSLAFMDLAVPRSVWVITRKGSGWGAPRLVEGSDPERGVASIPSPDWSPDGASMTYAFGRSLHVAPADSGRPRTIYAPDASRRDPTVSFAQWGRTGAMIYFRGVAPGGVSGIWSIAASGGRPQLVMRFDDPTRMVQRTEFAVDARHLYFPVADRASDLWVATISRAP